MTPEGQARVLEPIWQGFALSLSRLDDLVEDSEAVPSLSIWDRLRIAEEAAQARAYLERLSRAFDAAGLERALETDRGTVLVFPPVVFDQAARVRAIASMLEKRPELARKLEGREKAKGAGMSALARIGEGLAAARVPKVVGFNA